MVEDMLGNREQWQGMSDAGKRLVDGRGVERVAKAIVELMSDETA